MAKPDRCGHLAVNFTQAKSVLDVRHSVADGLSAAGVLLDPGFLRKSLEAARALRLDASSWLSEELAHLGLEPQLGGLPGRRRAQRHSAR